MAGKKQTNQENDITLRQNDRKVFMSKNNNTLHPTIDQMIVFPTNSYSES